MYATDAVTAGLGLILLVLLITRLVQRNPNAARDLEELERRASGIARNEAEPMRMLWRDGGR